eukprot:jgi/Mesvir1/29546/Mv15832-RA.1
MTMVDSGGNLAIIGALTSQLQAQRASVTALSAEVQAVRAEFERINADNAVLHRLLDGNAHAVGGNAPSSLPPQQTGPPWEDWTVEKRALEAHVKEAEDRLARESLEKIRLEKTLEQSWQQVDELKDIVRCLKDLQSAASAAQPEFSTRDAVNADLDALRQEMVAHQQLSLDKEAAAEALTRRLAAQEEQLAHERSAATSRAAAGAERAAEGLEAERLARKLARAERAAAEREAACEEAMLAMAAQKRLASERAALLAAANEKLAAQEAALLDKASELTAANHKLAAQEALIQEKAALLAAANQRLAEQEAVAKANSALAENLAAQLAAQQQLVGEKVAMVEGAERRLRDKSALVEQLVGQRDVQEKRAKELGREVEELTKRALAAELAVQNMTAVPHDLAVDDTEGKASSPTQVVASVPGVTPFQEAAAAQAPSVAAGDGSKVISDRNSIQVIAEVATALGVAEQLSQQGYRLGELVVGGGPTALNLLALVTLLGKCQAALAKQHEDMMVLKRARDAAVGRAAALQSVYGGAGDAHKDGAAGVAGGGAKGTGDGKGGAIPPAPAATSQGVAAGTSSQGVPAAQAGGGAGAAGGAPTTTTPPTGLDSQGSFNAAADAWLGNPNASNTFSPQSKRHHDYQPPEVRYGMQPPIQILGPDPGHENVVDMLLNRHFRAQESEGYVSPRTGSPRDGFDPQNTQQGAYLEYAAPSPRPIIKMAHLTGSSQGSSQSFRVRFGEGV